MGYQNELTVGAMIARKAGDLALQIREGQLGIEIKSDESPVTVADKACEALIAAELTAAFPEDGQMGEEGAARNSTNGRRWIIDPIDGTRDFIRGTGAWSVLIGLEENGAIVAGFSYFPTTGVLFSGALGEGAWRTRNGKTERIHARDPKSRADALLCCNGLGFMHRYKFAPRLLDWISGFWTVRSMGGCLDAGMVASGVTDVWIEAQAKPWDLAPYRIICHEAGLLTFDFTGKDTIYGGNWVICGPSLAEEIKAFLAS